MLGLISLTITASHSCWNCSWSSFVLTATSSSLWKRTPCPRVSSSCSCNRRSCHATSSFRAHVSSSCSWRLCCCATCSLSAFQSSTLRKCPTSATCFRESAVNSSCASPSRHDVCSMTSKSAVLANATPTCLSLAVNSSSSTLSWPCSSTSATPNSVCCSLDAFVPNAVRSSSAWNCTSPAKLSARSCCSRSCTVSAFLATQVSNSSCALCSERIHAWSVLSCCDCASTRCSSALVATWQLSSPCRFSKPAMQPAKCSSLLCSSTASALLCSNATTASVCSSSSRIFSHKAETCSSLCNTAASSLLTESASNC
mmetsp:Transcript_79075/g.183467  ORF Transcript_79075/g.183467 Transcript_79075/m.183467 type:complete len:313 (-) Transcript_79075:168-1106(-)